ncbi:MAG: hypothetical protein ASUL_09589, partial [Candidatus Aramenus sulfurataquae]
MENPQTQTQTPQEGSIEQELLKRIKEEEDVLISNKILETLEQFEQREDEVPEEVDKRQLLQDELEKTLWGVSRIYALLHHNYMPRIVTYDLLGFRIDELIIKID